MKSAIFTLLFVLTIGAMGACSVHQENKWKEGAVVYNHSAFQDVHPTEWSDSFKWRDDNKLSLCRLNSRTLTVVGESDNRNGILVTDNAEENECRGMLDKGWVDFLSPAPASPTAMP